MLTLLLLFAVALWAGVQNALAGGGSFVILPALIFSGLDARAASMPIRAPLFIVVPADPRLFMAS